MIDLCIAGNDYAYQRTSNFAVRGLEERLKRCYGGHAKHLYLCGSGMEAVTSCIEYLLPKTGRIVVNRNLYVETRFWLKLLDRYEVVTADMGDLNGLSSLVSHADVVLLDNPGMFHQWFDVKRIVSMAHGHGAKVVVDNSLASFYYYNPLQDGADIVVESYSKYVSGHGDVMAGAIVFGYEPDNLARLDAFLGWRGRVVNPVTAYMLEQRLYTLDVRLPKQEETCRYALEYLRAAGESVLYMDKGSVILVMGRGRTEAERLQAFRSMTAYGLVYSVCTPSHRPDLYEGYGDYLRLSFGLEDKDMLLEDIVRSFR